jgi:hypothetical protein
MKYLSQLFFAAVLAPVAFGQTGVMGGMTAVIRTGDFAGGRAVANQPYSARQISEHTQTLADGTHITQPPQETMLYRDSLGRTRSEHSFPEPPGMKGTHMVMIEINDPVAGVRYSLDSSRHVAHRMNMPQVQPMPVAKGATGTATWTQSNNTVPMPVMAARVVQPAPADGPRPEMKHESLGSDIKEGLSVTGQRTTTVYPVGFFGNDRPVTVVNEMWTSAELGMTVLSKMSDPRNGESTTRLTDVSRAEPAASLFQVPPEYTIEGDR